MAQSRQILVGDAFAQLQYLSDGWKLVYADPRVYSEDLISEKLKELFWCTAFTGWQAGPSFRSATCQPDDSRREDDA